MLKTIADYLSVAYYVVLWIRERRKPLYLRDEERMNILLFCSKEKYEEFKRSLNNKG